MLTPWLPPPLLTQDILSIPDMMQHSPLYLPWIRISVWKKKNHPVLSVFSAPSRETCMQPGGGWGDKCAAHCSVKSLIVSFPEWIRHPSGLFEAVCCGEQWTVLIPEHEAFHVQYFPSSVTTCSLFVSALLPFVRCPGQACLASFNTCNPLGRLWLHNPVVFIEQQPYWHNCCHTCRRLVIVLFPVTGDTVTCTPHLFFF